MIRSFKDSDTEKVWNLTYVKRFSNEIAKKAREKLQIIDAAESVNDLRVPPGNRLRSSKATAHRSTASGSTTSGASASHGMTVPKE